MGKPLINTKQWTSNDVRMLVIAHFILVYPILAGSIFMVLLFFVIPKLSIWVKAYWLIASGAWMLLLAVVLPLMGGGPNEYYPTGTQRRPKKKTKEHGSSTEKIPMAQDIRVEEAKMDQINRDSFLSNQSIQKSAISSSNASVEKGTLEEKSGKENCEKFKDSLNNSRENLKKSMDSICTNDSLNEKKALTQSGEFLNECVGKLRDDSDKKDVVPKDDSHKQRDSWLHKEDPKKQGELIDDKKITNADTLENDKQHVVAVVHLETHSPEKESKDDSITDKGKKSAEKEPKDDDSDIEMITESNDLNEIGTPELNNDRKNDKEDSQKIDGKTEKIDSPMNKTFIVTPTPKDAIDKQLCQETVIVDDEEEEEVGELVKVPSLAERRNQDHPSNVDTFSANKTIVDSVVNTPPSANSLSRRGSNVVHLFIKGD